MGNLGTRQTALDLPTHPSFSRPPRPTVRASKKDFELIFRYAMETAARVISPSPKEDDEDEDFSCDDLAEMLRNLKVEDTQ